MMRVLGCNGNRQSKIGIQGVKLKKGDDRIGFGFSVLDFGVFIRYNERASRKGFRVVPGSAPPASAEHPRIREIFSRIPASPRVPYKQKEMS
jgi:hypothetical protein